MAMISAMAQEKLYTHASAVGAGMINGFIAKANPSYSLMTTSLMAAVGLLGSLMLTGKPAEIMEGVGAGSLGSLGYSIPFWFGGEGPETSRADGKVVRTIISPRMLGAGNNGLGAIPTTEFDEIHMYGQ